MTENTSTSTRPRTEQEALDEVDVDLAELMAFLECFDPAAWTEDGK